MKHFEQLLKKSNKVYGKLKVKFQQNKIIKTKMNKMKKMTSHQIQKIIEFCKKNKLFVHGNVLWKYDEKLKASSIVWPPKSLIKTN